MNESINRDAGRISMNADSNGGKSGEQLLKEYGIDVIVMDAFDSVSGQAFYLPAALADPSQKEWKLVYQDVHDVIYMRNPPPDVTPLQSLDALVAMERQCGYYVENGQPACARGLIDIFSRIFDPIGITGKKDTGEVSAAQAMVDYATETLDRAEREKTRLLSQMEVAVTALQTAVDKLSAW